MIRLHSLKKSYATKTLFNDLNWHFPDRERIALVGPNGAGKTTLLNIICGLEEQDAGEVSIPGQCVLGYLPQIPNPDPKLSVLAEAMDGAAHIQEAKRVMEKALQAMTDDYTEKRQEAFEQAESRYRHMGGEALEGKAQAILMGLGFTQEKLTVPPDSLSGGWRMRVELAKVFLREPNFLILDEPTNHLDLPSLVWVEKYLQTFPGTVLFVSHDLDLLNRLPTQILHLEAARLEAYNTNFSGFLEEREQRLELRKKELAGIQEKREQMERFVERFGAKASKAKQAQSKAKMVARLRGLEEGLKENIPGEVGTISMQLEPLRKSGNEVCKMEDLTIGYSKENILFSHIDLSLYAGQRVAVIGANGIGKSTLLKTIAGEISPVSGHHNLGHKVDMAYFAQEQSDSLDLEKNVLENLMAAQSDLSEKEARQLLGSLLFSGDDAFKPVGVLSGGEKNRVGLAALLSQKANFLLLDEPTNHLDMSSIEMLAEALAQFLGTMLFVSHNRQFINGVATHILAMTADGQFALFEGKLDDYERLCDVSGFPNVLNPAPVIKEEEGKSSQGSMAKRGSKEEKARGNQLRKDWQKAKKDLEKLDASMHSAQGKIETLNAQILELSQQGSEPQRLMKLNKELNEHRNLLEAAEESWLAKGEEVEEMEHELRKLGRL